MFVKVLTDMSPIKTRIYPTSSISCFTRGKESMCLATNGFRGPGKPYNTALGRYRVKAGVKTLY